MFKRIGIFLIVAQLFSTRASAGPTSYTYKPAATTYKTCDLPDGGMLADNDHISISRNCAGSYNVTGAGLAAYVASKMPGGGGGENPQPILVLGPSTSVPVSNTLQTLKLGSDTALSVPPGSSGQPLCFLFVQDSIGGRKVQFPSNFIGQFVVGSAAASRSLQCFHYSSSLSAFVADSAGIINK